MSDPAAPVLVSPTQNETVPGQEVTPPPEVPVLVPTTEEPLPGQEVPPSPGVPMLTPTAAREATLSDRPSEHWPNVLEQPPAPVLVNLDSNLQPA